MNYTAPTSKVFQGNYNAGFISKNSSIIKPQVYAQMFNQYGDGLRALSWFEAAGQTTNVANATITHIEKFSPIASVTTGAIVAAGNAGASISVKLHADSFDALTKHPARVGFDLMIPSNYQADGVYNPRAYRIMSMSTTTLTNDTLLCQPYANGTGTTKSQIAYDIPSGTQLMVGPSSFAPETGWPEGTNEDYGTRTHQARLYKEKIGMGGDIIASPFYEVTGLNGQRGILNEATVRAEFLLDKQIDQGFNFSELNENTSNLAETSLFGSGTVSIKSGKGIMTWADERAQKNYYTTSPQISDFSDNRILLESQGVTSSNVVVFGGPRFISELETSAYNEIKEYGGGNKVFDEVTGKLGINLRTITRSGINYVLNTVKSYGNASGEALFDGTDYVYNYTDTALMIPMQNVFVKSFNGKSNVSIPNVIVGYVNNNGENRGRLMQRQLGVNGVFENVDVALAEDGFNYLWMAEVMSIVANANQFLLWRKSK